MTEELTAGAPILHPGRVGGVGPIHLGRTEARKKAEPALVGLCDDARDVLLVREPRPRWWRRKPRWCPWCEAYAQYLRGLGEL